MVTVAIGGSPTGGETVTVNVNSVAAQYTLTKADTTQSASTVLAAKLNEGFGTNYAAPYIASPAPTNASAIAIASIWPAWPLAVTASVTGGDITATATAS